MANPTKTEVKPLRPNPLSEADERLAPIGEFLMGPVKPWEHMAEYGPVPCTAVAFCGTEFHATRHGPVGEPNDCPDCIRIALAQGYY